MPNYTEPSIVVLRPILTHSIAPMKLSGLQLREFRYANANNVRRIKLHRYRFKKNDEFVLKL